MARDDLEVIFHELYLTDYRTASCEVPLRVQATIETLKQHYVLVEPTPASDADILLVHHRRILESVKRDTELYPAAAMAAGGAMKAAEIAMTGRPAFAAVRPPGHHASPDHHWGFCFFNNIAIAIERLLKNGDISSALVLDIDLHFGDGTDNFFTGRREVYVANIQENDRVRFLEEVDRALARHEYDIIGVSAGFDRHVEDWGATLTTEDYLTIGKSVRDYAMEQCGGRRFGVLEGGYNLDVLPENVLAFCRGMAGTGES